VCGCYKNSLRNNRTFFVKSTGWRFRRIFFCHSLQSGSPVIYEIVLRDRPHLSIAKTIDNCHTRQARLNLFVKSYFFLVFFGFFFASSSSFLFIFFSHFVFDFLLSDDDNELLLPLILVEAGAFLTIVMPIAFVCVAVQISQPGLLWSLQTRTLL